MVTESASNHASKAPGAAIANGRSGSYFKVMSQIVSGRFAFVLVTTLLLAACSTAQPSVYAPMASRDGYAEIEVKHSFDAGPGDVICMKTGGILSVRNESGAFAMSLHTSGRHLNHTGRSQFDPETNEARAFVVRVD